MNTNEPVKIEKAELIALLRAWINQRPGLEFGNYGGRTSYFSEMRHITQQLHDARTLLTAVENSGITAPELVEAFRAYSGRLQLTTTAKGYRLEYCTGQYWPTEYRAAACAVLASALWDYHRQDLVDQRDGNGLRATFRRMFGKGIQTRWLD